MKAGTSNNSSKGITPPPSNGPTREELNQFLENVAVTKAMSVNGGIPEIEAPRVVVEFYNKANLKGFDDVGYFIFQGIKVFEEGKVEEAKIRDGLTMEEKLHQGKK